MASLESAHSKRQQQQIQKMQEMQQHHAVALAHVIGREEERAASRHRPVTAVQVDFF